MLFEDVARLTLGTVRAHRLRTALTMLGIAIGTESVILLTSIGEGPHMFILKQFTQFGTNLIAVYPGKTETFGMPGIASTTRDLTLDDAAEILKVPGVLKDVPVSFGTARVEVGDRARSVFTYGVAPDIADVWRFHVRQGAFLPQSDARRGSPVVVLGPKLKDVLFGAANALGAHVHVGGRRFVVVGIN